MTFDPNFFRTSTERTGDNSRPWVFNHTPEHSDRVEAYREQVVCEYFNTGLAKKEVKSSNIKRVDRIRIKAFYAAYKLLYDLPAIERLVMAIVQTSNDMFAKADKAKIRQWELEYG